MPQPADEHGDKWRDECAYQAERLIPLAAKVSLNRQKNIIPKPERQAYVPPVPEVLKVSRKKWLAKIGCQTYPEEKTDAPDNVGIPGEIVVQPEGIHEYG
jgi:hypothetical protein